MIAKFENNLLGYYKFYYSVLGKRLFYSIFLSVVVSALDGLGLSMMMPLLYSVSGKTEGGEKSLGSLRFITDFITSIGFTLNLETVLVVLVLLFTLKGMVKYLEMKYQAIIGPYFMKKIRYDMVDGLKNITYKGFLDLDAGQLQNSFIAEVQKMANAVRFFLAYSQALVMLITYVSFAMLVNYQFAIILSISAGLTNLVYSHYYKKMKAASLETSTKGDNFNAFLLQAVHYFKYLKSTNYLDKYAKKLRQVIERTEYLNRQMGTYGAITGGVREPMILMIVVAVILIQVKLMGSELGTIILSLVLFYRALNFLLIIQQNWQNFLQNSGSLHNVSDMSRKIKERAEVKGKKVFQEMNSDIVVKNVDFSYGDKKVLNQVSLVLPRLKTIALVGESGSGKTTLANMLMGLITPDSGTIMVGGESLKEYDQDTYRSKIGYISQDSVIFNDTIYNNITFWAEPTPENLKRFWDVVAMSSLTEFLDNQSEKEHTTLGDHGILVSGGQKQRISIAREMFKHAEILILDEATSSLDSETELIIQENIEKLHGQYTMVVIAHRLSTIKNVDKIYLMEKGNVVISGNFENMVQKSEKFKRMVSLQGL